MGLAAQMHDQRLDGLRKGKSGGLRGKDGSLFLMCVVDDVKGHFALSEPGNRTGGHGKNPFYQKTVGVFMGFLKPFLTD